MLWQLFRTYTLRSHSDTAQMADQETPLDAAVPELGSAKSQSALDFFVGYNPQDEECKQYLLSRGLQRYKRKTQTMSQNRQLSSQDSQADSSDSGQVDNDGVYTMFKHFGRESNKAIDQLLKIDDDNDVVESSTTAQSDSNTRRKLSESLFFPKDQEIEQSSRDDLDFRQNLEKRIMNATQRGVRDVVLPLLLDDILTQLWKKTSTQSLQVSTTPQNEITTKSHHYPFFDMEVGYLDVPNNNNNNNNNNINNNKNNNNNDVAQGCVDQNNGVHNKVVLSSSYKPEEIFRTQWLKFVQMDKISVLPPSTAEGDDFNSPGLMPCIAFIEKPEEHVIDTDLDMDLSKTDDEIAETSMEYTQSTAPIPSPKPSPMPHANLQSDHDQQDQMNKEHKTTASQFRLITSLNDFDIIADGDREQTFDHDQQLRYLVEENEDVADEFVDELQGSSSSSSS